MNKQERELWAKMDSKLDGIIAEQKSQRLEIENLKKQVSAPSQPEKKAEKKSGRKQSAPKEQEKKQTSKKSEVPVLTEDQLKNWSYYKACRSSYCYKQQGCKVWRGKVTKPEGFEFDRAKWDKDKAAFEKVNKYVKKADR